MQYPSSLYVTLCWVWWITDTLIKLSSGFMVRIYWHKIFHFLRIWGILIKFLFSCRPWNDLIKKEAWKTNLMMLGRHSRINEAKLDFLLGIVYRVCCVDWREMARDGVKILKIHFDDIFDQIWLLKLNCLAQKE